MPISRSLLPLTLSTVLLLPVACSGGSASGADVSHDAELLSGSHSISGTVTLPASIPSGTLIQIRFSKTDSLGPSALTNVEIARSTDQVTYAITGLEVGTYKVRFLADATGNGALQENGDYGGYFDGTVTSPIQDPTGATEITVDGAESGMDFGVALQSGEILSLPPIER